MKKIFLFLVPGLIIFVSACSNSICCKPKGNTEKQCSNKTSSKMKVTTENESFSCSLTKVEMQERLRIIESFKTLIREKRTTESGLAFEFEGNNKNLEKIMELIELERKCCSFLTFDLKIQKEAEPLVLIISGPEGTMEFLSMELGL